MAAKKIAIIGGGNLGSAIAMGLIKSGFSNPADITITKRNTETLKAFEALGVQVTSNNAQAISEADVVLVALKPYNVKEVIQSYAGLFQPGKQIVISVVTGVLVSELQAILPDNIPVFRAMPNTAIAIQESVTCICQQASTPEQQEYVKSMFDQVGVSVIIDEKLMDAATVLGACGIAYALRFIRANIQGGIEIGFDVHTASLIAAQTVKGAAELLIREKRHPEEEIDKVTTPKGCTIAGLNEMEHQGFSSSLIKGIRTSYDKITKR